MKRNLAILGSTGSIGTQALEVVSEHPDLFEVYALTANNQVDLLINQARKYMPEVVVIANEQKYPELKEALEDLPIKVWAGSDAIAQVVQSEPIDMVLTAMVGYAGENHDRLGVDDEQGVRNDRGEVAVRGYAGTDTGRGASAVGDPFDGSV